ncbi:12980_t:CDS:2, partial [Acaulospora colombiana]
FNPTPARPQPAVSPFEDDDEEPDNKSKNGSSRSLSRFFSKSSDVPPLPVSSKDDTSAPSSKSGGGWNSLTAIFSNKRSTSNLSLPNEAAEMGENPGYDYPPSNPYPGTRGVTVNWREKVASDFYTGDMGSRKRQGSSVTRSDYDVTHVVAFGRRPSDTPSHAASQDGARSNSDTWSRSAPLAPPTRIPPPLLARKVARIMQLPQIQASEDLLNSST